MYHINYEGKIYPCKARIRKCPYGEDMHAKNKEELYYRIMKVNREVEPTPEVISELSTTGRIRSLYPINNAIENVEYPIEIIISNLDYAINTIRERSPKDIEDDWKIFAEDSSELVYNAMSYGIKVPDYVPYEISGLARDLFKERLNSKPIDYSRASRNRKGLKTVRPIENLKNEFKRFKEYKKWGLTDSNKEGTLRWLTEDFYQFSHDLNTSKMLTQPIFYGDLEKAKNKISQLNDYELLSAYDDHLLTSKEVMDNVKLANNFKYEFRRDLSKKANMKIKNWYDINARIVESWSNNAPKRVMLSIEMANELDRRGIKRQENPIGR